MIKTSYENLVKPGLIELKLRDLSQLFNSMDPSPFHEKDLDHDAEEFIVSWAQEYSPKEPLMLRIHLEQRSGEKPLMIEQAVHNYFLYRKEISQREFRHLMKLARTSLLIGSVFLASCLLAGNFIQSNVPAGWVHFFKEGLTIVGWVAMWRPIQLYLYDWWPVYRQIGIYQRLGSMAVEIVSSMKSASSN